MSFAERFRGLTEKAKIALIDRKIGKKARETQNRISEEFKRKVEAVNEYAQKTGDPWTAEYKEKGGLKIMIINLSPQGRNITSLIETVGGGVFHREFLSNGWIVTLDDYPVQEESDGIFFSMPTSDVNWWSEEFGWQEEYLSFADELEKITSPQPETPNQ